MCPPSRGLLNRRRLQLLQEVCGALGMRGGGEDGAGVALEDREPVAEIRGVILTDVGGDAEIGAEEGGTKFRDQLFTRIAFIAEAVVPPSYLELIQNRVSSGKMVPRDRIELSTPAFSGLCSTN